MTKALLALCLLTTATVCPAQNPKPKTQKQARPDLSGVWMLDPARSNLDKEITAYTLTITHREPEIKFSKRYKRGQREIKEDYSWYTDGRPDFGPSFMGNTAQPQTHWQGSKLVRKTVSTPVNPSFNFEFVSYEEWSLSPDGQTLTRIISNHGPGYSDRIRSVFRRSP